MENKVAVALDRDLWQEGISYEVFWDYKHFPHVLCFGSTGSGKTYAVKLLIGTIALKIPQAKILICDFKADDFKFLNGCTRYFQFTDCAVGLDAFVKMFEARQSGTDESRDFRLLVFDEWASYCNNLDKKAVEEEKRKLATLLMLGRSFNVHVLVSQQRADAEYFAKSRDNFSVVIALGNISKESCLMFGFDRDAMKPARHTGEGHILFNGDDLRSIVVPTVSRPDRLEAAIRGVCGTWA